MPYGFILKKPVAAPAEEPEWWESVTGKTPPIAYQAIGAANKAAAMVNLANPGTLDLVDVNSPGWDAVNGFVTDIINQVITDGIPAGIQTIVVRFSGVGDTASEYYYVFRTPASDFAMSPSFDTGEGGPYAVGYSASAGGHVSDNPIQPSLSSGVLALVRDISGLKLYGYRDGVIDLTETVISANISDAAITFGLTNGPDSINTQAAIGFIDILSAEEIAIISAAMALL